MQDSAASSLRSAHGWPGISSRFPAPASSWRLSPPFSCGAGTPSALYGPGPPSCWAWNASPGPSSRWCKFDRQPFNPPTSRWARSSPPYSWGSFQRCFGLPSRMVCSNGLAEERPALNRNQQGNSPNRPRQSHHLVRVSSADDHHISNGSTSTSNFTVRDG